PRPLPLPPPTPPLPYTTLFRSQTAAIYPREYVQQGWKRSSPCSKLLQGIPAIAAGETQQRGLEALADYQYLEQFAHLSLGNQLLDRKSTRLNSSHVKISYAVFC